MRTLFFILLFFILLGVGLLAASQTNYFTGTVLRDNCRNIDLIVWSNLPPAIVIEGSTNMTTWHVLVIISYPVGTTNQFRSVEYPVGTNSQMFYRLRQINQIVAP